MRASLQLIVIATAMFPSIATADIATADISTLQKRAKSGDFDATGEVRCAQEVGQSLGPCQATVARDNGSAAVVVTFENGFSRTLLFGDRVFLRGNATMSGVGTDTQWNLSDGIYSVRVDDQRFALPEVLVIGDGAAPVEGSDP